jgi:hypothetical protein
VRILVVSVLLGLTAACAPPPPGAPGATPSASAIAAFLAPPVGAPPPVALVPAPVGSVPAGPVAVVPAPGGTPVVASVEVPLPPWVPFGWLWGPESGGRLTLSNFSYDTARVQAVLTNGPDCAVADPAAAADFIMPLNATRIIPTPAGVDVCWRREVPPTASSQVTRGPAPAIPGWADWNRSYTGSGRFIDARL